MKKRTALKAAVLLTLAVLAVSDSSPAAHRWMRWHWARARNPFTLGYTARMTGPWSSLVAPVMNRWDTVHKLRPGTRDIVNWVAGNDFVIEARNYGPNGWFGLASLRADFITGHIVRGRVQLNDFYFKGQYDNDVARRHVLCQEVGHILGLDHNEIPEVFGASCMDDRNSTLNRKEFRFPNHHDAAALTGIYQHRDAGIASGVSAAANTLGWVTVHITPAS